MAFCRAKRALPALAAGLTEAGIGYQQFDLYQLKCPAYEDAFIDRIFEDPFDLAVFTAPSAVKNYFSLLHGRGLSPGGTTRYACLGLETARQLEKAGHSAWIIPDRHHVEALVKAVLLKWGGKDDVSQYPHA